MWYAPPERHELAINVLNCNSEGPLSFYKELQLKEGITGKRFAPRSGAFHLNDMQLCAVSAAVQVRLVVAQINGFHSKNLKLGV
jgi:hypothetical protein